MTNPTQQFTVADPTTFDGDPFEVAERALRQASAVAGILEGMLSGARSMARNAEMERQLLATGECDAAAFEDSAQARKFDQVTNDAAAIKARLSALAMAAGYNPRKPVEARKRAFRAWPADRSRRACKPVKA